MLHNAPTYIFAAISAIAAIALATWQVHVDPATLQLLLALLMAHEALTTG